MNVNWIWLIPMAPLVTFAVNGLLALWSSRPERTPPRGLVQALAVMGPAVAFAVSVYAWLQLRSLAVTERVLQQEVYTWIASGDLRIDVGFTIDPLSSLMLLFVTGVGTLIHVYSVGYMAHEKGFARFFVYLNLFMFSMLILVLGNSLPLLFVGWEGVGLCSYLLIGYWYEDMAKSEAGKKAFVVNRIGDFGVLIAMFLIVYTLASVGHPSLRISDIQQHMDAFAPGVVLAICLLLFLGATGKSAQIPLYVWLPDAMAGPTPVSALIHAATMVTAGVYLVARLGFLFSASPEALSIVALIGALTAVVAATIGIAQNDFKKVLAYSTVSQLGYMFVGVGVGAYAAGIFHVFTHAFFKACLFLGSGAVIHALHDEQDIRKMGGLRRVMPVTFATFVIATLALAGMPPLAGFFSKDHILWEALSRSNEFWPWLPKVLWALLVLGAFLTAFYMWRLVSLVFLGQYRGKKETYEHAHEAPFSMAMPLVVLAVCSVGAGFLGLPAFLGPNIVEHWLAPVFESSSTHMQHASLVVLSETSHAEHSLAQELGAMGAAFGAGLLGLLLGHYLYAGRPRLATTLAERFDGARRLLEAKYFVDEFYNAVIVQPIKFVSDKFLWRIVDARIIDGIVNLVGGLAKAFSYVFRFVQSGYVQTYLLVLVFGLLIFLYRAL